MNFILENSSNISSYLFGLFQFQKDGVFDHAVIGITEDELRFYNDGSKGEEKEEGLFYPVLKTVKFEDISKIFVEKLKHNKAVKKYSRINFVMKDKTSSFFVYFTSKEKASVKKFLKVVKKKKIKVKKRKVDLSRIY